MRSVYSKLILAVGVLWISTNIQAQQSTEPKKFSLQEAISFAKKNNYALKNNQLDVIASEKKVKEVLAIGLPQVNASGNFTNNAQIPTQVLPNFLKPVFIQGGVPGANGMSDVIAAQFGQPYTATGSVTANQLLFDGGFLMGVKAAKEFVELARLNVNRNEIETEVEVTKAYYLALLQQTNMYLLDTNIISLKKAMDDSQKAYENGLSEKTDFDRIKLQYSTLQLQRDNAYNQAKIATMVLELQLGMNVGDSIVLTDKLNDLYQTTKAPVVESKINYSNRVEYKAIEQQIKLNTYDKKRYQFGYAPSLGAFFTHQENTFGTEFGSLGQKWYPGTIWGLNLNLPVFDGLRKSALIQQAKINIQKSEDEQKNLENTIIQQVNAAKMTFELASQQVKVQEANLQLAQEIYDRINVKYKNGLSSSLDLTNSQNDLANSRQLFLNKVYDYFVAQVQLRKAIGDIK